jgi:hypothetical protein
MSGERIIGAALSENGDRDFLYERMVKPVSQRPELLSELAERFESDDLIE